MATYAIGDIQGCFKPLQALLKEFNYNPEQDILWFVGDLVNRGPDSLDVLRWVKSLGNKAITVLGNHDLHLLAVAQGIKKPKSDEKLQALLAAPDLEQLIDWLRQQPLMHYDQALNLAMVHAGFPPQWDLNLATHCADELQQILRGKQWVEFLQNMYGDLPDQWDPLLTGWERLRFITNCFTRIRYCDSDGRLDLQCKGPLGAQPASFMPWYDVPGRASMDFNVLFGHWAALKPSPHGDGLYHLDTGCVWGNSLTAMRLEDKRRYSIPCNLS